MRILVFFCLLIACLGMAVLSQVGDESLSRDLDCFSANSSGLLDQWDLHNLKDAQCAIGYLANVAYNFTIKCWLVLTDENMKQFWSIITKLYYAFALYCAYYYSVQSGVFKSEDKNNSARHSDQISDSDEELHNSDDETGNADDEIESGDEANSLIPIEILYPLFFSHFNASRSTLRRSIARNEDSLTLRPFHGSCVQGIQDIDLRLQRKYSSSSSVYFSEDEWEEETNKLERSLVPSERQGSYVGLSLDARTSECGYELGSFDRLCRSWSSMSIDIASKASSLLFSDPSTSSHLNLPTSLHADSRCLSISSSSITSMYSSSHESLALSRHSTQTIWTMYRYPVPASITSSSPHQVQLQRAKKEFIFIQRPFAYHLPLVTDWLRDNFCGGETSHVNQESLGRQDGQRSRDNEEGECSNFTQSGVSSYITQSSHSIESGKRDTAYLINNGKTEVVLCGIPAPFDAIIPSRSWGSMFQLDEHKEKWPPLCVSSSLPNITEEFGLKNRVGFNVESLENFDSRRAIGCEEKNDVYADDNLDSLSVQRYKTELRDQERRDAARAKFEQNRMARVQQRLRLFREQEELEATTTAEVVRPSFYSVFKHEMYKQVVLPLLLHTGKEVLQDVMSRL